MANKKLFGIFTLLLIAATTFGQGAHSFKINEVVVCNQSGLVDEYGERNAWIEIANTSWGTNNLRNCYFTNDRRVLNPELSVSERVKLMTAIPRGDERTNLKAKQCIVFFADSFENRGSLHLGFRLLKGQPNFIALFDANGKTLLDSLTVPANLGPDLSYARVYNAVDDKFIMLVLNSAKMTPGSVNAGTELHEDKVAAFKEKDPYGIGMSVMGMGLVFLSLILLYIFFRIFGQIARALERVNRLKAIISMREHAHKATVIVKDGLGTKGVDKEIYAAVIAMALSELEGEVHDLESGRITIVAKPTSWNSKASGLNKGLHK
ncbi:MAG: OadG family protein [Bacteroidaceae bacterium]